MQIDRSDQSEPHLLGWQHPGPDGLHRGSAPVGAMTTGAFGGPKFAWTWPTAFGRLPVLAANTTQEAKRIEGWAERTVGTRGMASGLVVTALAGLRDEWVFLANAFVDDNTVDPV